MSKIQSKVRRFVWWAMGIALLAAAVVIALRPQPVLIDTAIASAGPLQVTVDEDGVTRIRERYIVSTPLSGRLLRIAFDVGDEVEASKTIIARMEPTDPTLLDPRTVAQARAHVKAAERKLAAAKSELVKAEAAVNFAETEMGRVRELQRKNAASEAEFDEKQLMFRQRTEETRVAGFAVEIAEYELELQKAALLLTDPDASDDTDMELAIKAPIDGRILRIYQESAAVLNAGAPLMEIGDPADLEIVVDVLSRDAVRINPGSPVLLEQWGGDRPLAGRVRLVEPAGFTKLSALGVEEQRVNVIVDLVDPPEAREQLGDSFRVDCRVVIWQSDNSLRIPTSALFRVDDRWHVFAVIDGVAQLTSVKIGQNNGVQAEVMSGLDSGTTVVVHPGDDLADGVVVKQR
jgi:HlyD family secretion protein